MRLLRSRRSFAGLSTELSAWFTAVDGCDPRGQYRSAIAGLRDLLLRPCQDALAELVDLERGNAAAHGDESFSRLDRRALAVRRLWDLFRLPFDQRRGGWEAALRAADEVAWSCHQPPFRALDRPAPAPVPSVSPDVSPLALGTGSVRDRLSGRVDAGFLNDFLSKLPMPLVQLPPWAPDAPWGFAFIAHECGHHLQFDLQPARELEAWFARGLQPIDPPAEGGAWTDWGREIFADIVSVVAIGPAALHVVAEIEQEAGLAHWTRPRHAYPAPARRLQLMADALRRLDVDPGWALADAPPPAPPDAAADQVLQLALGPLGDINSSLPELYNFAAADFAPGGEVAQWAAHLAGQADREVRQSLPAARQICAASVQAWAIERQGTPPAALDVAWTRLRDRTIAALQSAAEPGERSAHAAPADAGLELAKLSAAVDAIGWA